MDLSELMRDLGMALKLAAWHSQGKITQLRDGHLLHDDVVKEMVRWLTAKSVLIPAGSLGMHS